LFKKLFIYINDTINLYNDTIMCGASSQGFVR
jgi:hypothetical protein